MSHTSVMPTMDRDYLIENSAYLKRILSDDMINQEQEKFGEMISKFPDCFIKYVNEFIEHKNTENLSITLENYKKIYEAIDMFEFKRDVFLRDLETYHYQGTRNIYQLSGEGWDLYLPETQGWYVINNTLPENLENVKTQYGVNLQISDSIDRSFLSDESVRPLVTELFLFHVKVFYYSPYIQDITRDQHLYVIPEWILDVSGDIHISKIGIYPDQKLDISHYSLLNLDFSNFNQDIIDISSIDFDKMRL
jgi:predicted house-cleaning noncanonical NTP pyrophosphatase (MazG superfamily)